MRDFLSSLAVEAAFRRRRRIRRWRRCGSCMTPLLARPLSRSDDFTPAPRREREPTVLSENEVRVLLAKLSRVPRLCAELMYGSGGSA